MRDSLAPVRAVLLLPVMLVGAVVTLALGAVSLAASWGRNQARG